MKNSTQSKIKISLWVGFRFRQVSALDTTTMSAKMNTGNNEIYLSEEGNFGVNFKNFLLANRVPNQ
jgi:hypothetical protein